MKLTSRVAAAVFGVVLFAPVANATPLFYSSESNFNAAATTAGITLSTNNLDSHPLSLNVGNTPSSAGGITISIEGDVDWALVGTGNSVFVDTESGGTSVTFTFSSFVNAFGIDIFDLGSDGPTDLTLSTATGSKIVFDDFSGPPNNTRFAGVVDNATSFQSVTITNSRDGGFFELDNVQFGSMPETVAVPTPATGALLGAALLALCLTSFRRRVGEVLSCRQSAVT